MRSMPYETLQPTESRARLDSEDGWTYLDVRTPEEFTASHVAGAYNVPIFFRGPMGMEPNQDFLAVVQRHFAGDAKLVVGCAAGMRSMRACEALEASGYAALVNMDGGFNGRPDGMGGVEVEGWTGCGFPTTTEPTSGRTWGELSD
tara:strand:+ start:4270 stop:4707 length:438 start_codon:yes stop_codon:yes gene_type:complete